MTFCCLAPSVRRLRLDLFDPLAAESKAQQVSENYATPSARPDTLCLVADQPVSEFLVDSQDLYGTSD
jgi:hypothetical protein